MTQSASTIAPASCRAKTLQALEVMIAHCPAFLAACAAADPAVTNAEAARSHIGWLEYDPKQQDDGSYNCSSWPFAIIAPDVGGAYVSIGTGDAIELLGRGDYAIVLAALATPGDNVKTAVTRFLNFAAKVEDELAALSGVDFVHDGTPPHPVHPVHLPISVVNLDEQPTRWRADQRAALDYWTVRYSVTINVGEESQ